MTGTASLVGCSAPWAAQETAQEAAQEPHRQGEAAAAGQDARAGSPHWRPASAGNILAR